jgi:1-phosphofructokinase
VIVTVTPNPSVDRTVRLEHLERGGVIRATGATAEAGGKGVNVARALASQGIEAVAVVPLAADSEASYGALLRAAVAFVPVPVAGAVRVNISLVEPDGTVTKINEPGPYLSGAETDRLLSCVAAAAARASWVVGCGSLPPGAPDDFYARLARLRTGDRRVAIDASGAALRLARPVDLLKPNHTELQDLVGETLPTLGDVVRAATQLVEAGASAAVLVSLGPAGAVHVDASGARHAEARVDDVANSVGAGDALLAGYLAGGGGAAALKSAVAWSVSAVRSAGTRMGAVTARDLAAVVEHDTIDLGRPLAE